MRTRMLLEPANHSRRLRSSLGARPWCRLLQVPLRSSRLKAGETFALRGFFSHVLRPWAKLFVPYAAPLVLLLCCLGALPARGQSGQAQTKPSADQTIITKVFEVKYGDVDHIASLIRTFSGIGDAHPDRLLKVISVRGEASAVQAAGEAIEKLDKPSERETIDLTAYLLIVSHEASTRAALPKDIEEVMKALKATLDFQGCRLLDTLNFRTLDGEGGGLRGVVHVGLQGHDAAEYNFHVAGARVISKETPAVIWLSHVSLHLNLLGGGGSSGITTDLNVREGQKVVVGKTAFGGRPGDALVLVLTAKAMPE
jgi:hypothetical protein